MRLHVYKRDMYIATSTRPDRSTLRNHSQGAIAFVGKRAYICLLLVCRVMKKIVLILALAVLSMTGQRLSAQTPYVGGSLTLAYVDYFKFDQHFYGGYEFNDKWAVGGGLGLDVSTYGNGHGVVGGFMGAYVRFTPWHNPAVPDQPPFRRLCRFHPGRSPVLRRRDLPADRNPGQRLLAGRALPVLNPVSGSTGDKFQRLVSFLFSDGRLFCIVVE